MVNSGLQDSKPAEIRVEQGKRKKTKTGHRDGSATRTSLCDSRTSPTPPPREPRPTTFSVGTRKRL